MKILPENRRHTMFSRFVLSCVVLLIIPIIVITAFSYGYFVSFLRRDAGRDCAYTLANVRNALDEKVIKLISIAVDIQKDYRLTPYAITRDVMGRMEAINELKKYRRNDDAISEIGLYIHGGNEIYTASSTYSVESFITSIYRYQGWSRADFYDALNAFGDPVLRCAEPVRVGTDVPSAYLTYLVPGVKSRDGPGVTIMFLIREEKLRSLFGRMAGTNTANIVVFDRSGRVITSYRDVSAVDAPALRGIGEAGRERDGSVRLRGVKYLYTRLTSDYTGWTHLSLVRNDDAMGSISELWRRNVISVLIALTIGIAAISYLVRLNYTPLRQLKEFSEKLLGRRSAGGDEIAAIRDVMTELEGHEKELESRITESLPAVKDFLLQRLLRGTITDAAEFNAAARGTGMRLTLPTYSVVIFAARELDGLERAARKRYVRMIHSIVDGRIEGYGRGTDDAGITVFVLALRAEDGPLLQEGLRRIQRTVHDQLGVTMTVGVGTRCDAAFQIGRSYMEANAAIDYRLIMGENTVIFFENVSLVEKGKYIHYPDEELKRFQFSLKQGNGAEVEETLTAIISFITRNAVPLLTTRCIYYDLITTIIRTLHDFRALAEPFAEQYCDIDRLNNFSTVEEFVGIIREICARICGVIRVSKESHNDALKDRVIRYIADNSGSASLSVSQIAECFGVSQPYISRFFRDQTGQTLSEYITDRRMERAKSLLGSTEMTLREIIALVGYANETSFVRTFKRREGITPGEYRRLS